MSLHCIHTPDNTICEDCLKTVPGTELEMADDSNDTLLECIEGPGGWREQLTTMTAERDQYAARIVEQDAEHYAMMEEREAACGELLVNIDDTPVGSLAGKLVCANRVLRSAVSAVNQQLTAMTETAKEANSSAIIERADRINAQAQLTLMRERADENQRKYETQCVGTKSRLEEIQRLNCVVVAQQQEIERLKAWMNEFIEGNACIPKDYAAGVYTCNQCHVESQPNGDFIHLDDCDIVECRQLLAGTKEGT